MARRRFFVDQVHHQRAELNGEEAHHLTRVLRVERGQRYEISDNHAVYLAEVAEARKERVLFSVIEKLPAAAPVVDVTLLLALIKFDHFESAVEKATEAGVARIVPVQAERSEKGLDKAAAKRMARWRRIALEASQQSRRDTLPAIEPLVSLRSAVDRAADHRYFLDERPDAPPILNKLPQSRDPADTVALLVGPEGGWTAGERSHAVETGWRAASLGPQILRAETAAVAGVALVVNAWWAESRI